MRVLIVILSISILFGSFCKEEQIEGLSSEVFDVNLNLQIMSESGEDYLNPENPNHLKFEKIRLFYLNEKSEKTEVYNQQYKYPRDIRLSSPTEHSLNGESPYRLILFTVIPENNKNKTVTMYLQWNEDMEDEIQCEYVEIDGNFEPGIIRSTSTSVTKVWINSELIWGRDSDVRINPNRILTIIK